MGWLASASAALIATSSAPLAMAEEIAPTLLPGEIEIIDLERERHNRLTVEVTIGEHGPYDFLIDTGAQATVLSSHIADALGMHDRSSATLVGIASRMQVETIALRDIGLGTRNFDVELAPLVPQQNIGGAHGILGLDSLQEQRVMFDFANRTIAVADADALGGNRGYEIVVKARRKLGQLIITRARLDGVRVAVIIDTGAQGSIGNIALQDRLRGRDVGEAQMTDVNGMQLAGNIRIARSVKIGRASINNIPIVFAASPTFEALGLVEEPALLLGMSELKLFQRVAIDFRERKVLFDLPAGSTSAWMRSAPGTRFGR